jgi:hypothetical protein
MNNDSSLGLLRSVPVSGASVRARFAAQNFRRAIEMCVGWTLKLLLLVLSTCTLLHAQTQLGTGSMSGVVVDPKGSAVPDAAISVVSREMGVQRHSTTSSEGDFQISVLPPGHYDVLVEKDGFNKLEVKDLLVTVGSSATVTLKLQVGSVSSQVEVVGEDPPIDTTQTSEGTLLDRNDIDNLPINGRRYDQFALLSPGVTKDSRFGLLSVHGVAGVFNNFTIEGNDDNQALFSEARGRTRIASSISANAIQEFQVITAGYLPEFGRTAGGGVNTTVRSGGNAFHFDAFYYFRDSAISALDPITKAQGGAKAYEQRQQFGGSIGGAIIKNKLFFFVNYDQQIRPFPLLTADLGNVLTAGNPTNAQSPSPNCKAGLTTSGCMADIAAFNAGVAALSAQFPGGAPNNTIPRTFNQQSPLEKVDWIINQKNSLSVDYNYLRWHNINAIQTPAVLGNVGRNGTDDARIHSVNVRLTTAFTPTLVNEARFQYGRDNEFEFPNTTGPQVFVGNQFSFGTATFLPRSAFPDERRHQFVDNISKSVGTHALKFGFEFNRAHDILDNPANFAGTYNYTSALTFGEDLLNPGGQNYTSFSQSFGLPGADFATIDWALYAQDQWKIRRNVTLNYGLRWDYQQLPSVEHPNPALPNTQNLNAVASNVGPRIGVAWDLRGNGKTVVRADYSLVYGRTSNGILFNSLLQTGLVDPTQNTISLSAQPGQTFAPTYPNILPSLPAAAKGSVSAFQLAPDFQNPRVQEYNAGITRELSPTTTISVSYVHTYGDRLPATIDSNLPAPQFTRTFQLPDGTTFSVPFSAGPAANLNSARPNPNFGAVTLNTSTDLSWYNALLVDFKRRFDHGLSGGITYTLAKAESLTGTGDGGGTATDGPFGGGNFQNQFDPGANKGASSLDQRHRANVYAVFQPGHVQTGHAFTNGLINNWGFSTIFTAETGRPYSPILNLGNLPFVDPATGVTFNGFGGLRGQGGGSDRNILPTLGRDSVYGDNNFRWDLRVSRSFQATERLRVEIFAEGFNILNHSNYNGFNSTILNSQKLVTTNAPALATPVLLTPLVNQNPFGSPNNDGSQPDGTNARRLQFSLRLKF